MWVIFNVVTGVKEYAPTQMDNSRASERIRQGTHILPQCCQGSVLSPEVVVSFFTSLPTPDYNNFFFDGITTRLILHSLACHYY
jgi:hypothetical protein